MWTHAPPPNTVNVNTVGDHEYIILTVDDDNKIPLQPIPDTPDCQEDYINACYVDVSLTLSLCTLS